MDDEPIHLILFQKVLKEEGIIISERDYYARYLGMDDRGCFKTAYQDHGRNIAEHTLADLVRRKALYYRETIEKKMIEGTGSCALCPISPRHRIRRAAQRDRIDIAEYRIEKIFPRHRERRGCP
ncbi:MAG: hypothetical protein HYV00_07605 [Deltaproteobacteria bacterium]|nr:hypothetical protein [Deltaproteobacteria bacterium]